MEDKVMNPTEEIKIEDTNGDVAPPEPPVYGEVSGCKNLNIRKNPVVNDKNVLCIVPEGTMVMIVDPSKAKRDWWKVMLEDGTEGFCMKEFVTVEE